MKEKNNGFTLVEMLVSIAILTILLATSVMGLMAWQDWADFNRENEYAQTLFVAAQNQMAEFNANGRLVEMQESLAGSNNKQNSYTNYVYDAVGLNLTGSISSLKDSNGEAYDKDGDALQALFPESKDKGNPSLYQDEIISLRAEAGEYLEYLDNPARMKKNNPEAYWVFELVGSYVYDSSILNGNKRADGTGNGASLCIEITAGNGQIFSVFYSDKKDKFIYKNIASDKNGNEESEYIADISDRSESYRRERMVGYYGVDTLYTATKNEMIRPSLSYVKLYNKDTFYMTFKLSTKYQKALTGVLTYDIDLNGSKHTNDKVLSFSLDGTKLKRKEDAQAIECPVKKYDKDGKEVDLGTFPILAWVEADYSVHVILDAADVQAITSVYESEYEKIHSDDKNLTDNTQFSDTYSFFRFGVDINDIYASVVASAEGYTPSKTVRNFGNLNPTRNQSGKHPVFAGETKNNKGDGVEYSYAIKNARHLYNIRYIEDISYAKEMGDPLKADQIKNVTFEVKDNIDWQAFQESGQLFDSYSYSDIIDLNSLNNKIVNRYGKPVDLVNRMYCNFPSIGMLRERDVIKGNDKIISGITCSEISNALYGIYDLNVGSGKQEISDMRPTGLVSINFGLISDLKIDNIYMTGSDFVGGFCGINAGKVTNLEAKNSKDISYVIGKNNVGGIMGFQLPTNENLVIENLVNRSHVEGVKAVGGIMGMVRNDFSNISIVEFDGLSMESKKLLNQSDNLKVTVQKCKNYGAVAGINSSELKGIYKGGSTNTDKEEPRYIGGIAGYCYNKEKANMDAEYTERIKIEQCVSSPQYDDAKLLSIVKNDNELNKKIKGVYVGGIVGYNYYCQINDCSTMPEKDTNGYMFGYRYVGGIVGYNIGPASGIIGTSTVEKGTNNNHVIGYEYAGGITGCNASTRNVDSQNNNIATLGAKDPENLVGVLEPDQSRALDVKIDNWVNKGIVIATNAYSGGITGYNTGYVYRCNSVVESGVAETYFATLYSGDFAGGIAGYNNGIIGNTKRKISDDGKKGTITELGRGEGFSTICYVKGHNYVGGIVGYNDVDAIVEDYEVTSGYVIGDKGSCFVGGYAGLNASINLLMDTEGASPTGRFIYSNPNKVEGDFCVGGNIGGNIINTRGQNANSSVPIPTGNVYAKFVLQNGQQPSIDTYNKVWYATFDIKLYNNSGKAISDWAIKIDDQFGKFSSWNLLYDENRKTIKTSQDDFKTINSTEQDGVLTNSGISVTFYSEEALNHILNTQWPVSYSYIDANGQKQYAAEEPQYGTDVILSNNDWGAWAQYSFEIHNYTDTPVEDWKVEVITDKNIKSVSGWGASFELKDSNTVILTVPDDYNKTLPAKGYLDNIGARFEFEKEEDCEALVNASIKMYSGDALIYSLNGIPSMDDSDPVGPSPDQPEIEQPSPEPPSVFEGDILAQFKTDNFLGVLNGKEFVGGFIGYNLVFDDANDASWVTSDVEDGYRGAVYVLQKNLVKGFENTSRDNQGLVVRKEIVDDLNKNLGIKLNPSKSKVVVSGKDAEVTTTAFGSISGDIYVGGVLGYNDNNTELLIFNVENATPVTAREAVFCNEQYCMAKDCVLGEEKHGRHTDYLGREKHFSYSYVGGIVGKVSEKTIINNCWNSYSGSVITVGTYLGGLCEINEGLVTNCDVKNFGSGVDDYLGGICGLNKGEISNCRFDKETISGRNVVGGIAAENFGRIEDIMMNTPSLSASGMSTGDRDGVAGLFAGYNGETGEIILKENLSGVTVRSDGKYVGAVVGVNNGNIENAKVSENGIENNLQITGFVQGYYDVGSLIGLNLDSNQAHVIKNYTNKSTVIALTGNAGGIVGENASSNKMQYCVNESVVSATIGNAGGITSENRGLITNCYDFKSVYAPKGVCGGIVSVNGTNENADAVIQNCVVKQNNIDSTERIKFESTQAVGGIAAMNYGVIKDSTLEKIEVTNVGTILNVNIGVVVGRNESTGRIYLKENILDINDCLAVAKTNNCDVGGVAGVNRGLIANKKSYDAYLLNGFVANPEYAYVDAEIKFDGASYGSLGGVAGLNTGTVAYCQVDGNIEGSLGTNTSGYGGVVGYSGFETKEDYATEIINRDNESYRVEIIGCTFDGKIAAPGSAGNLANIGGIAGVNAYGGYISSCSIGVRDNNFSDVESKTTYITSGDLTKSVDDPDLVANANIGGIAGYNFALIEDIDLQNSTRDNIEIIAYTGSIGGLIGYQNEDAVLTGYKNESGKIYWVSSPKTMHVEMRRGENDFGAGGIIGYCRSGHAFSYMRNYAHVENYVNLNVKTGGIFGTIEQQLIPYVEISNCENYGKIEGRVQVGGLIGRTKYCSVRMIDCTNYGEVYASKGTAGGFIARVYDMRDSDIYFTNCKNHGNVTIANNSDHFVAGFVGVVHSTGTSYGYFYNCDNTGIIARESVTSPATNVGSFVGTGNSVGTWYFENCQNYNTSVSNNGFIGNAPQKVRMKNCLDNSNTKTSQSIVSPFAPANISSSVSALTNSNFEGVYYLNSNSNADGQNFDRNAGAYFTFDRHTNYDFYAKGNNYKLINNPAYYVDVPSSSNILYHGNGTKEYELHVTYDKSRCVGMKDFNIYIWNGSFSDTTNPTLNYSFDVSFTDVNGNKITVNKKATSTTLNWKDNVLTFEVPSTLSTEITDVSVKSVSSGNVYYHGFSYTPVLKDGSIGKETQCTYLAEKNDTTYHIASVKKNGVAFARNSTNGMPTGYSINDWDDLLGLNLGKYERFQFNKASAGTSLDFTFEVNNGAGASGMKSFVFYPANDNTNASTLPQNIRTYYYGYKVTFTDKNGEKASVEGIYNKDNALNTAAIAYDSVDSRYKQPCVIDVPENLDSEITEVNLSITDIVYTQTNPTTQEITYKTSQTSFYCRGFGWIPKGESQIEYMAVGPRPGVEFEKLETNSGVTQLYCDYSQKGTTNAPYVYSSNNYDYGFNMSNNDPIHSVYYDDKTDYSTSKSQIDGSNSRINVYEDLHKNFISFIQKQYATNKKLNTPVVSINDNGGKYEVTWNQVPDAYAYEVKYEVIDAKGESVFNSKIYEQGKGNTTFKELISSMWEGYRVNFYVRAVNAYRYTGNDTNIYRYDSEWGTANKSVAVVLPQPVTHLEVTAGNRFVAFLDNRDDYINSNGDYMECLVNVTYEFSSSVKYNFVIDVAEGYISDSAIKLEGFSQDSDYTMVAVAVPKEGQEDVYLSSNKYLLAGHMVDNSLLTNLDRYVPAYFRGFCGTDANQMTYDIYFASPDKRDSYINSDIISYDEQIGCYVAYSSMNSHVAAYVGNGAKFTATLSNIPMEWFSEDYNYPIIAREYLESSQFHIVQYEHLVKENVSLDGSTPDENIEILKDIKDAYYLADDGDDIVVYDSSIWDEETNSLKPGYTLRLKYDKSGKRLFDIYYNVTIELATEKAEELNSSLPEGGTKYIYSKNCVDYKLYAVNKETISLTDAGSNGLSKNVESASVALNQDYQEYYCVRNLMDNTQLNETLPAFDKNVICKIQELQPAPIIEEKYEEKNVDGHRSFTFSFDEYYRDAYCMTENFNSNYLNRMYYNSTDNLYMTRADASVATTWAAFMQKSGFEAASTNDLKRRIMNSYFYTYYGAQYRVDLIGTTLEGEKAVIATIDVTEPHKLGDITNSYKVGTKDVTATYERYNYQAEFTDVDDIWKNYSAFSVRVMRLGELNGIAYGSNVPSIYKVSNNLNTNYNSASFRLPRYSELDIKVMLKLNSVNNPKAGLHQDDGDFVTDNLIYDVSFGSITNESQLKDLGGYLITAKVVKPADEDDIEKTHYYYVQEIADEAMPDTIALDKTKLEADGVLTELTPSEYRISGNNRIALLDLSDFNTNDVVEISVKAIARERAENYEDSDDGTATQIQIAERLHVPTAQLLTVDDTVGMPGSSIAVPDSMVGTELYKLGMAFAYGMDSNYEAAGLANVKLKIAVAVYDSCGDLSDASKVKSGEDTEETWNEGAIATLYSKGNPLDMGYVKNHNSTIFDLAGFEQYTGEYADKWLKIVMKATSEARIDSKWSDQDSVEEDTINYVWIHIPKLMLDDVDLSTDSEKDVVRYWDELYGGLYDEKIDDESISDWTEIACQTLGFTEDKNLDAYDIVLLDKLNNTTTIHIRRHLTNIDNPETFDGTWDVFLEVEEEVEEADSIENSTEESEENLRDLDQDADETGESQNQDAIGMNPIEMKEVLIGRIGIPFDADNISDDSIVETIDLGEYIKESYLVMDDEPYEISPQLQYVVDENGVGKFLIVLPDITAINEMSNVVVDDDDAMLLDESLFSICQVLVTPSLSEASKEHYIVGKPAWFERSLDEQKKQWVWNILNIDFENLSNDYMD